MSTRSVGLTAWGGEARVLRASRRRRPEIGRCLVAQDMDKHRGICAAGERRPVASESVSWKRPRQHRPSTLPFVPRPKGCSDLNRDSGFTGASTWPPSSALHLLSAPPVHPHPNLPPSRGKESGAACAISADSPLVQTIPRRPTTVPTVTRIPRMQALPPMTAGSKVILSKGFMGSISSAYSSRCFVRVNQDADRGPPCGQAEISAWRNCSELTREMPSEGCHSERSRGISRGRFV